ncbi:hypothetical protein [Shewanella mangrovi]|nr:hypothetical protein [Shewanella mangrovi]
MQNTQLLAVAKINNAPLGGRQVYSKSWLFAIRNTDESGVKY